MNFSSNAQHFVLTETDGSVRVFDAGNGRSFLNMRSKENPKNEVYLRKGTNTSHCWVDHHHVDSSAKLVLSSTNGIEAIDVVRGEVLWRMSYDSGVSTITIDPQSQRCYFASIYDRTGGTVNLKNGQIENTFKIGKHKAKHLLVLNGMEKMLVGGSHLTLWDAVRNKTLIKYTGHPTDVTVLTASPTGHYALSTAEEEKHVAIWLTKGSGSERNAVCLLSVDDPVTCLSTTAIDTSTTDDNEFAALALTTGGVVYVWKCQQTTDQQLQATLWAQISHRRRDKDPELVGSVKMLSAVLQRRGENIIVVLAHGNVGFPSFEDVYLPECENEAVVIELEPPTTNLVAKDNKTHTETAKKRKRAATLIGADSNGEMVPFAKFMSTKTEDPDTVLPSQRTVSNRSTEIEEPQTLGERLRALQQRIEKTDADTEAKKGGSLTASAASVLVCQINQSGDMELYNRAMRLPPDIVTATVKQLSSHEAAKFLQFCTERLHIRPKDALSVIGWFRAIVKFHAGYLMSAPNIQQSIAFVHQMMENRLAVFDSLVALSGRVDLLLAQAEQRNRAEDSLIEVIPQSTVAVHMSDEEGSIEEIDHDGGEIQNTINEEDVEMADS